MRLGFHYHEPVYLTSQGALKTSGPQGRFLDSLAEQCNEVVCFLHSPRTGELPYLDYSLRSPNVSWVNVGPHRSLPARMLRSPLTANRVKQWQDRLDVVLLRGPSPLLPAFARALKPLPIALLLVGDYVKVIQDSPQPAWRKALIRVWAQANARGQLRAARRALTLVNSRELYGSLHPLVPNVHLTQTTTLTASDFLQRDDTCSERPIRLLYAGRMDRGKGLLVLVEALRLLLHRGEDVVLDLAGPPQPRDNVLAEASDLAERLGIGNRIVYHGFRPLGDELFGFYKRADLFVLPSLRTEGFPRSLWEAMAYSLPVVATAVGSIPDYLRDGHHARIVAPRSPGALADGVSDVIHKPRLRRALIRNGFALARDNTLERRSRELVSLLRSWIGEQECTYLRDSGRRWLTRCAPEHLMAAGSRFRPATLIVGNFLSCSLGNRAVCEELSENLRQRGWRVMTASSRAAPLRRLGDMLSTVVSSRHEYRVAQVDVFSGRAFFWAEAVASALRVVKRPFVLTLHGGNLPAFSCQWPNRVRGLLQSAHAVTAPSPHLLDSMRRYRRDLILLPNPLDLSAFPFRLRAQAKPRLIWLRAFHRKYNPTMAPRVLAALVREFPDIRLTMLGPDRGDGSLDETREVARKLGVDRRLRLPGGVSRDQLAGELSKGDVFLNTTSCESFGVSVMEAAALGLCVVTTDAGALPSIWTDQKDALLVPEDDPSAMAHAVRRILTEPSLAAQLSRQGRQRAERCDRSRVMPRWESLLGSLAV